MSFIYQSMARRGPYLGYFAAFSIGLTGCMHQNIPSPNHMENQRFLELETFLTQRDEKLNTKLQRLETQQQINGNALIQIEGQLTSLVSSSKVKAMPQKAVKKENIVGNECAIQQKTTIDGKLILGRVEWVMITALRDKFKARIDSGATTSSLSSDNIQYFERDGQRWVKFLMTHDGQDNIPMESPLIRFATIRQASSNTPDKRPVIQLNVRIGQTTEVAEFTLTDRSSMTYPMLLGRSFLTDLAIIDVAQKFVQGRPKLPNATLIH